jgi:excinuclease UvrABC nuclease subunit
MAFFPEVPEFQFRVNLKTVSRIPYNTPGVYVLYNRDGSVMYVGLSKDLRIRVSNHLKGRTNTSRYDQEICNCKAFVEESWVLRHHYEELLIKQLKPPLNIHYNKKNFRGKRDKG